MSTRLHFNAATPHGRLLADALNHLYSATQQIERVLAAAQSMTYGGDYAQIEAELGLDAGKGADMAYKLQALADALHDATLVDCRNQLDQG